MFFLLLVSLLSVLGMFFSTISIIANDGIGDIFSFFVSLQRNKKVVEYYGNAPVIFYYLTRIFIVSILALWFVEPEAIVLILYFIFGISVFLFGFFYIVSLFHIKYPNGNILYPFGYKIDTDKFIDPDNGLVVLIINLFFKVSLITLLIIWLTN